MTIKSISNGFGNNFLRAMKKSKKQLVNQLKLVLRLLLVRLGSKNLKLSKIARWFFSSRKTKSNAASNSKTLLKLFDQRRGVSQGQRARHLIGMSQVRVLPHLLFIRDPTHYVGVVFTKRRGNIRKSYNNFSLKNLIT